MVALGRALADRERHASRDVMTGRVADDAIAGAPVLVTLDVEQHDVRHEAFGWLPYGVTLPAAGQRIWVERGDDANLIVTAWEPPADAEPGVGPPGPSAYEVWLAAGNVGDVNAYLASLKGAKGDAGTNGTNGADGATGAKGDKGDKGDTGATGAAGESIGVGAIQAFAITPSSKWILCDWTAITTAMPYSTLRSGLVARGNPYGVDGSGNPRVPDARGRTIIGAGQGTGLTNRADGATVGTETHVLTLAQMPSHTHTVTAANLGWGAGTDTGRGRVDANSPANGWNNLTLSSEGSGSAHPNMQPSIAMPVYIRALP